MSRTTAAASVLAAVVGIVGCPTPKTASDWPDDPKSPEEAQASCARAGERLEALQCKERRKDFTTFCTYMLGRNIPLHPQCLAKIETCNDVEKC